MIDTSSRPDDFERGLAALRMSGRRPTAADVADLGVQFGMPVAAILDEIAALWRWPKTTSDALLRLISSLCGSSSALLEYAAPPTLLTAAALDSYPNRRATIVTTESTFADALRTMLAGRSSKVILGLDEAGRVDGLFDTIVCYPPFGGRPTELNADGFGGEVVTRLRPRLEEAGTLYWVTGSGAAFSPKVERTLESLSAAGLRVAATVELAPGTLPGTAVSGVVFALRQATTKRFVAIVRDSAGAESAAKAFLGGPTSTNGPNWAWLDTHDNRLLSSIEQAQTLKRLLPRGRYTMIELGSLLSSSEVQRADPPAANGSGPYLFVPEYAGSKVTAELDDQTVKPAAVYRLAVDPAKAHPQFLADLLNGPYGRLLRESVSTGATIQRISGKHLLELQLPVPPVELQEKIVRLLADVKLLSASLRELGTGLERDWTSFSEVEEKLEASKAVFDIERRIADWWRELPYPLATVYRRYCMSIEPRERLDAQFHFFELAAVYVATLGASYVRALRPDWEDAFSKWLHPKGGAGIERADFGFWVSLGRAALKDANRICSDGELRRAAAVQAGPELVRAGDLVGQLRGASDVLDAAREYRNTWKGHGGLIKASDAQRLSNQLGQSLRDFYGIAAPIFRELLLVRAGEAEITAKGFNFVLELLVGSDPTFAHERVELSNPARSHALSFWAKGSRNTWQALPFIRLGAPQEPREATIYVFNRVEKSGFRWISYQEAAEQDFVAADPDLSCIIDLGRSMPP